MNQKDKPEITMSQWLLALNDADQVPANWYTVLQIMRGTGKSRSFVTRRLKRLIKKGKAECRHYSIPTSRSASPIPHYHLLVDEGCGLTPAA